MAYIDSVKKSLEFKAKRRHYEMFAKATEGMADDEKHAFIDSHVMMMIHHLLHDIKDKAHEFRGHERTINQNLLDNESRKSAQSAALDSIAKTVKKIVAEYGGFKLSNPNNIKDIIGHMVDSHPVVPKVIKMVANGQMDVKAAAQQIIEEIEKEPDHDKYDMGETALKKSMGLSFLPFGYASSASSRYRPSPNFILFTSVTPDEEFVKTLMKLKGNLPGDELKEFLSDASKERLEKEAQRQMVQMAEIFEQGYLGETR